MRGARAHDEDDDEDDDEDGSGHARACADRSRPPDAHLRTLHPKNPMNGSIFFYSTNPDGSIEWIGSAMIWVLLALSVANVVLIAIAASANRRRDMLPEPDARELRELLAGGRYQDAIQRAQRGDSDLARMMARALDHAPDGTDAMVRAAEQAADEILSARLRGLEKLNILGQVAPMIGLFGTVYGMIVAFQGVAASGGAADPVLLAGGIGTALVTTFWGLLIAIPALSAYAMVRNGTIAVSDEALSAVDEMVSLFRPKGAASVAGVSSTAT
jgi:biopolymer transport protein ExbB